MVNAVAAYVYNRFVCIKLSYVNNCILAQLTVCVYVFSNNTDTEPAVAERLPGEQAPAVVGQRGEGVDDHTMLGRHLGGLAALTVVGQQGEGVDDHTMLGRHLGGLAALTVVGQQGEGVDDHTMLGRHLGGLAALTASRPAASLIALHAMQWLAAANYTPTNTNACRPEPLTNKEEDILVYISGYLFKKSNDIKGCASLKSADSEASGFLAAKDRGGLVKPSEAFVRLVREMEVAFRQLPLKSADYAAFHSAVISNNTPSKFCVLLECVDITAAQKEDLFVRIITLFFVVRMHKKCRQFIERCIQNKLVVRKSKPLRASI